jgi:hypothetical protein
MLGIWPIGTRPLGALRRQGIGPVFAVFAAVGTGTATYTATAQARSTVTSAGNGAAAFTSNNGLGVLASAGLGTFASTMTTKSSSSLTSAGVGATSLILSSLARSVLSSNCTGSFVPVMTAKVSSNTSMQGSSSFGSTDSPGSALNVSGFGIFTAVGYASFLDAEKAGPAFEQRTVWVPYEDRHPAMQSADVSPEERIAYALSENKVAVAPYEDRVYYVKSKPLTPGPPNRRRIL